MFSLTCDKTPSGEDNELKPQDDSPLELAQASHDGSGLTRVKATNAKLIRQGFTLEAFPSSFHCWINYLVEKLLLMCTSFVNTLLNGAQTFIMMEDETSQYINTVTRDIYL